MFYLKKKTIDQIHEGDRVMVLADFSGVPAGTRGTITENDKTGVMVEWYPFIHQDKPEWEPPRADGFGQDELDYLAFETQKHPKHET